jgi:hypothetical protein
VPTMPRLLTSICLCVGLSTVTACNKSEAPLARANGKAITQTDFDAYVKLKGLDADTPEKKAGALNDYASRVGLAGAIESEKLVDVTITPAELEAFKTDTLVKRYFEKFLDDKVTDRVVEDYYKEHIADYQEQKIRVAHILFRMSANPSDDERKARLTAANNAYTQAHAGKDFGQLAATLSDDKGSGQVGGDLGWLRVGNADPMLIKRALTLKPGEVSEPFEGRLGYHVIKLIEPVQLTVKPLRAAQNEIRDRLRAQAKTAETDRLLAKAQVEVDGKPRGATKEQTTSAATDKPNDKPVAAR